MKTKPRPLGICTQNFMKIGPAVPEICSQTDSQTDKLIAILRSLTGAEQQYVRHSMCLPRHVQCLQYNNWMQMSLCFINLIRHSITCGTARVTVYVILMQTTLHSHILSLYMIRSTLYSTDKFVNCDEEIYCCFICFTQLWDLHIVTKRVIYHLHLMYVPQL